MRDSPKRFRVAFSFAGEKRDFVSKVASILASRFGEEAILYDKYHEAEFARRDLGIYLPDLYHDQSDLIVVVVCPEYDEKEWTGLEWTAIHDLLKKRQDDDVMLCHFEHATLKGLFSTAGWIELDSKTPEQTADLILQRLALNEGKPKDHYTANERFLDAIRLETEAPPEPKLTPDAVDQLAAQLLPTILEELASHGPAGTVPIPQQLEVRPELAPLVLDPPPLVANLCERRSTVENMKSALVQTNWLAIRADSGWGKTQLAALVARQMEGPTLWVRLRDRNSRQAAAFLDACFRTIPVTKPQSRLEHWIPELCSALSDRTLIVLDDLPRFDAEDPLGIRLLLLVRALSGQNTRLLSTSGHRLSTRLTDALGERVCGIDSPLFTETEIAELLLAHGAPPEMTESQRVNFITTVTHGHPVLLVAVARFLKDKKWRFTDAEIDDLLRGEHATLIADETLERLIATISDEHTRSLLYRLRLTIGEFSTDDANAVASVDPVIDRSSERLHDLTGLWVQRESHDRFKLSPLVKALPEANLPIPTRRETHFTLGTRILRRRVLDPFEGVQAILHFVGAEQHDRAAFILLQALQSILRAGEVGDASTLLMLWANTPIAREVTCSLRVLLRAYQIEARSRHGLSVYFALSDLKQLVTTLPEEETWALLGIIAVAGRTVSELDPTFANRIASETIRTWSKWRGPDGEALPLPEGFDPVDLLWMTARALTTNEHIRDWLSAVRQLSDESRARLFASDLAEDCCITLANRPWLEEHKKSEENRDWETVQSGLDELITSAGEFGQTYLKACAVRAKIIVIADYQDDISTAVAHAEQCLADGLDDPRAEFLIRESVGCQYTFKGMFREARDWFAGAFAVKAGCPTLTRVTALVHASRAFGQANPNDGVRYADEAILLAEKVPHVAENMAVQIRGEVAIARWLADDRPGAYAALDEAAEVLNSSSTRDAYWQGLFMCFGHTCGYFAGVARTGKPPSQARDGSPWAAPERGFFFRDHGGMAELYVERQAPTIFVHLTQFAEGVASDSGADKWAARGLEAARTSNLPTVAGVFANLSIVPSIARGEYERAIELGIESGRQIAAAKYLTDRDGVSVWEEFDVDSVLQEAGESLSKQAEEYGAMSVMLAVAFHIARELIVVEVDVADRVGRLTQFIQELAVSSPCQQHWEAIVDVFERILIQREPPNELVEFGNQQSDWLIKHLAYFGSTLHPNASLVDAAVGHLTVLSVSASIFDAGAERRIILPFIDGYWRAAFERERFRFSAPSLVESELQESSEAPAPTQTRMILRTIARGLGVRISDSARSWLAEGAAPPDVAV